MKNTKLWANISLFNFCAVALLGLVLRSKILFDLPWINYLNLLDAHSHLAFGGWITLALLMLFVKKLLMEDDRNKHIYQWILFSILSSSVGGSLATILNSAILRGLFSGIFIVMSYLFAGAFIKDICRTSLNKSIKLLSISAVVCLILSSLGPLMLTYLRVTGSSQSFFYRDALYIYLHFQYNGFFILSVFALLFQKLYLKVQNKNQRTFYWFSLMLCVSILPSLFLSFLWQAPNEMFRWIAAAGSITVFATVTLFIIFSLPVLKLNRNLSLPVRAMIFLCAGAFVLKMILQSLTISTVIGNAVFGDRPIIIGFLHLVFLGLVSPFIVAYYTHEKILSATSGLVIFSQFLFVFFVALNELILMLQGLGAMFLKGSNLFSWSLWITSIGLLTSILLIFVSGIKSRTH